MMWVKEKWKSQIGLEFTRRIIQSDGVIIMIIIII